MINKIGVNPWFKMWIKPKSTIRKIVDYNPNLRLFVLSAIYGFVSLISSAQTFAFGEVFNLFVILAICLLIAPIWGYLFFCVSAFFIYYTGKWLKGQAGYKEVRSAIAWSNVPMIINVFLWVLLLIIFKNDILKDLSDRSFMPNFQKSLLFIILFCQLVISIWIFVLYINSLAEVQRFSIGRSILNIIFGAIIFVALFFIISVIYFFVLKGLNIR